MSVQFLSYCSAPTRWDSMSALQTFWSARASPSGKENRGLCMHMCHMHGSMCLIIIIYRSPYIFFWLFLFLINIITPRMQLIELYLILYLCLLLTVIIIFSCFCPLAEKLSLENPKKLMYSLQWARHKLMFLMLTKKTLMQFLYRPWPPSLPLPTLQNQPPAPLCLLKWWEYRWPQSGQEIVLLHLDLTTRISHWS